MIPVTSCEHETFKGKNHTMRVGMLPPHSMCVIYIEREYVGWEEKIGPKMSQMDTNDRIESNGIHAMDR